MEQPDFFAAFDPQKEFTNSLGTFRCETREIKEVNLPSGRVVIGDPLVDLVAAPLAQRVAPGRYPVIVAIAHLKQKKSVEQRIACAMLRISGQRPVRWVNVVKEERDDSQWEVDGLLGYGVDTGMGCFASVESAEAMGERMDADEEYLSWVLDAAEQVHVPMREWVSVVPDTRMSDANVVVFSSGMGDGFYASYWGYDERDEPVCLITDFTVVHSPEAEPTPPGKRPWWKL
jgi:hypothetical protein